MIRLLLHRRWSWLLVAVVVASGAALWPRSAAAACDVDIGCYIDVGWVTAMQAVAQLFWKANAMLLLLSRWLEEQRQWLVEDVLREVFRGLLQGTSVAWVIAVIIAVCVFIISFCLQAVVQLNWVDAKRGLRNGLLALFMFTYGAELMGAAEQGRLLLSDAAAQVVESSVANTGAMNTLTSGTQRTEDTMPPTATIYPGDMCDGAVPARATTRIALNDIAANYLFVTGEDVHCVEQSGSPIDGSAPSLPTVFWRGGTYPTSTMGSPSGDPVDFVGFYAEPADQAATREERRRIVLLAEVGALRQFFGLFLTIPAVLEALIQLVFALALVSIWFALSIGLVFALFVPTEGMVSGVIQAGISVIRQSVLTAIGVALIGFVIRSVASAPVVNAGLVALTGMLGMMVLGLLLVNAIRGAATTALSVASATLGAAPQAVGGLLAGAGVVGGSLLAATPGAVREAREAGSAAEQEARTAGMSDRDARAAGDRAAKQARNIALRQGTMQNVRGVTRAAAEASAFLDDPARQILRWEDRREAQDRQEQLVAAVQGRGAAAPVPETAPGVQDSDSTPVGSTEGAPIATTSAGMPTQRLAAQRLRDGVAAQGQDGERRTSAAAGKPRQEERGAAQRDTEAQARDTSVPDAAEAARMRAASEKADLTFGGSGAKETDDFADKKAREAEQALLARVTGPAGGASGTHPTDEQAAKVARIKALAGLLRQVGASTMSPAQIAASSAVPPQVRVEAALLQVADERVQAEAAVAVAAVLGSPLDQINAITYSNDRNMTELHLQNMQAALKQRESPESTPLEKADATTRLLRVARAAQDVAQHAERDPELSRENRDALKNDARLMMQIVVQAIEPGPGGVSSGATAAPGTDASVPASSAASASSAAPASSPAPGADASVPASSAAPAGVVPGAILPGEVRPVGDLRAPDGARSGGASTIGAAPGMGSVVSASDTAHESAAPGIADGRTAPPSIADRLRGERAPVAGVPTPVAVTPEAAQAAPATPAAAATPAQVVQAAPVVAQAAPGIVSPVAGAHTPLPVTPEVAQVTPAPTPIVSVVQAAPVVAQASPGIVSPSGAHTPVAVTPEAAQAAPATPAAAATPAPVVQAAPVVAQAAPGIVSPVAGAHTPVPVTPEAAQMAPATPPAPVQTAPVPVPVVQAAPVVVPSAPGIVTPVVGVPTPLPVTPEAAQAAPASTPVAVPAAVASLPPAGRTPPPAAPGITPATPPVLDAPPSTTTARPTRLGRMRR